MVLDTNVLVAGLRSRNGTSFLVLGLIADGRVRIHLSVPLVLEYEDVLLRSESGVPLSAADVGDLLDSLCASAVLHEIFYLWRPQLRDPQDDLVLELAVKAGCRFVVTHNQRDFVGCERFGIEALPPAEFLRRIGALQ
ncbi:MAG TPA: putative toxin-antitoxin system toxin component, PIN family [Longimicrobium sp.]